MKGPLLELFSMFSGRSDMITVVLSFFSVFVIIFLCFPLRAYMRGLVASKLGDDTPERSGMLTMNPLAHIDLMGALCMCICCIGWSKPMPISVNRCHKVSIRKAAVLIALTGPLSLIVMALVLVILSKITLRFAASEAVFYLYMGIVYAAQINIWLAVLNLLPIPGFDGYTLIQGALPRKQAIWVETNAHIINIVVFVLLISGVLTVPLQFVSNGVMWFLNLITSWI